MLELIPDSAPKPPPGFFTSRRSSPLVCCLLDECFSDVSPAFVRFQRGIMQKPLSLMRERFPKCPLCKSEFHYKHVDLEMPFRCPVCDQWLRVAHSHWYAVSTLLATLLVSGFVCFELGARGASLFWSALFVSIPIFFFGVFWKMHFAPPKLIPSSTPLDTNVLGLNR